MNLLFNDISKYNRRYIGAKIVCNPLCCREEEKKASLQTWISFSELARELDFTEEQIHQIRIENPNSLQDQSHALLKYWLERDGKHATGLFAVIVLIAVSNLLVKATDVCYNHKNKIKVKIGL